MSDKRRVLALLELGWTYRRIELETGVRRETIARYDPQRQPKAANLSTGSDVSADEGMAKAANLSAGSKAAHGPPGLAVPYHAQEGLPSLSSSPRCAGSYPTVPKRRGAPSRSALRGLTIHPASC
jgi:hypothetical protein